MLKGHKSKKKMLTLVFLIINHEMFAFATRKNGWQCKLKSLRLIEMPFPSSFGKRCFAGTLN